jgi:hypothetical protein
MACGLNLIFRVMRVINFVHGNILAIAALDGANRGRPQAAVLGRDRSCRSATPRFSSYTFLSSPR